MEGRGPPCNSSSRNCYINKDNRTLEIDDDPEGVESEIIKLGGKPGEVGGQNLPRVMTKGWTRYQRYAIKNTLRFGHRWTIYNVGLFLEEIRKLYGWVSREKDSYYLWSILMCGNKVKGFSAKDPETGKPITGSRADHYRTHPCGNTHLCPICASSDAREKANRIENDLMSIAERMPHVKLLNPVFTVPAFLRSVIPEKTGAFHRVVTKTLEQFYGEMDGLNVGAIKSIHTHKSKTPWEAHPHIDVLMPTVGYRETYDGEQREIMRGPHKGEMRPANPPTGIEWDYITYKVGPHWLKVLRAIYKRNLEREFNVRIKGDVNVFVPAKPPSVVGDDGSLDPKAAKKIRYSLRPAILDWVDALIGFEIEKNEAYLRDDRESGGILTMPIYLLGIEKGDGPTFWDAYRRSAGLYPYQKGHKRVTGMGYLADRLRGGLREKLGLAPAEGEADDDQNDVVDVVDPIFGDPVVPNPNLDCKWEWELEAEDLSHEYISSDGTRSLEVVVDVAGMEWVYVRRAGGWYHLDAIVEHCKRRAVIRAKLEGREVGEVYEVSEGIAIA